MSGEETIQRATMAYLAGMISTAELERWVGRGVSAGQREVANASIYLPFAWEIDEAKKGTESRRSGHQPILEKAHGRVSDRLTEDERADVDHDLTVIREAEETLMHTEPVSPEAAERRNETLQRLRGELARVNALLTRSDDGDDWRFTVQRARDGGLLTRMSVPKHAAATREEAARILLDTFEPGFWEIVE